VKVEVWRDGKKRDVELTLGERPLTAPKSGG
jgi:S1-C subfamily serine protease